MILRALFVPLLLVHAAASRRHHHAHLHRDEGPVEAAAADDRPAEFNPYTKHAAGRHVCTSHKTVTQPVKTVQTFCKPIYKKYTQRCNDNQLCSGVRLVYETAYRDVFSTGPSRQPEYVCCPGWSQASKTSHGCSRPVCAPGPCLNGGSCARPGPCSCPLGWRGGRCEHDVDECAEQKPCDQICRNSAGSYSCDCREQFVLQPDGHSCRDEVDGSPALEAGDLEREALGKRLAELEALVAGMQRSAVSQAHVQALSKKLDSVSADVKGLKSKVYDYENGYRDLKLIKSKIHFLESKANTIDELARGSEPKKCPYNKIC